MDNIIVLFEVSVKTGKMAQSCYTPYSAKSGRMNDFADYKITVVTPVRTYTMTDRAEAPADSNKYFGGIDL